MPMYRAQFVTDDGCREIVDVFHAANDGDAIKLLQLRLEPVACELWCQSRRVATVPAKGGPPIRPDFQAVYSAS